MIISARAYGSWIYGENAVDVDVAVIVPDRDFVVQKNTYQELRLLRHNLSKELGIDLDLIPHTSDEIGDINSPLWNPRYNPSLIFGNTLKGDFPIEPASLLGAKLDFSNIAAYVLHDNRTICRRQLLRSLNGESGKIFASKLLHGPGNALTYHACKHERSYVCSPSDLARSLEMFDEIWSVNSSSAIAFLISCKDNMDFESAVKLMSWYESLIAMVLMQGERSLYQHICIELA